MKKVLLINASQPYEGIAAGGLNKTLAGVIQDSLQARGFEFQHTAIADGYDTEAEVDKHTWADLIILQSPVYWFGTPWIYKKYADEVFMAALLQGKFLTGDGRTREDASKQYGSGGLMQDKKYMLSLTWNAPSEAFNNPSQMLFEGKSVDDVFVANTANYKFCGAEILPAFSCFDVVKAPSIEADIERLRQHLAQVV
jgi:modulator of drug activity B